MVSIWQNTCTILGWLPNPKATKTERAKCWLGNLGGLESGVRVSDLILPQRGSVCVCRCEGWVEHQWGQSWRDRLAARLPRPQGVFAGPHYRY